MKFSPVKLLSAVVTVVTLASPALAQSNPPIWDSSTSYKIGDLATYQGTTFQCLITESTGHPNPHTQSWDVNFVYSGNFNIPVGPTETFKTLASAWIYIKYARIAVGSKITISLDKAYSEVFYDSFSLDHPFGSQVFITGGNSGQSANFVNLSPGFVLDGGHVLGGLQGLLISAPKNASSTYPAILVKQKAVLCNLSNINLKNFNYGLQADSGEIDNVSAITFSQFIGGAVMSTGHGAVINFAGVVTVDGANTISTKPPLYGFLAQQGGSINCPSCVSNNCTYCFEALTNGAIYCSGSRSADGSSLSSYLDTNYFATGHGLIVADGSQASGAIVGYQCDRNSYISALGSRSTGSPTGYNAAQLSGIDATASQGGSVTHDSTSYVLT